LVVVTILVRVDVEVLVVTMAGGLLGSPQRQPCLGV
jgi:hypothetical protein